METAPAELPPKPSVARPSKRCPHDYCRKDACPVCYPCVGGHGKPKWSCTACNLCPGGHGKQKWRCGICTDSVEHHDPATVPDGSSVVETVTEYGGILRIIHHPTQQRVMPGEKCNHTRYVAGRFRGYSSRQTCPICSDCGHGKIKSNCKICSDCGHGNLKAACSECKMLRTV